MERSDFGTNDGVSGGADDVSFDRSKTAGSASSAGSASVIGGASTSDTEVETGIAGSNDTGTADVADATGSPNTIVDGKLAAAKQKIGAAKEKVVDRMHATADWIKERDVEQLKGTVEQQVRDHPGRTLLIAVGLGYLIGRAFRGGSST